MQLRREGTGCLKLTLFSLFYNDVVTLRLCLCIPATCEIIKIKIPQAPILHADVKCFGMDDCYPLAFGVPAMVMLLSFVIFMSASPLYARKAPSGNMLVKVLGCIFVRTNYIHFQCISVTKNLRLLSECDR